MITEKDLSDHFSKIVSAEITDITVKHHKCIGYIEFEEITQYEEAKLLGKHDINGRTIECKRAKARDQVIDDKGISHAVTFEPLYISNLTISSILHIFTFFS